ncbi:MAG: type II secretion system protein [Planctomycetes bacterium]|nr:type II secretion system protein [Planctomycetota bacterium]
MGITHRPRSAGRAGRRAFTLIEVLVVVAIIALLVSILIPSLAAAREQAKRTLCASNLHQQQLAMNSYSKEHKDYLPWRGWFSYTISEVPAEAYGTGGDSTKVLVNLALLMGKHLGSKDKTTRDVRFVKSNDWDVLYCPNTKEEYQNAKDGGLPTLWDAPPTGPRFTWGGYNYGVPMASRVGSPRFGLDVYPRIIFRIERKGDKEEKKYVLDGRWCRFLATKYFYKNLELDKAWDQVTQEQIDDLRILSLVPRGMSPLVIDATIGGFQTPHRDGINAAYSDGHARFVQHKPSELKGLTSGAPKSFALWYDAMHHP